MAPRAIRARTQQGGARRLGRFDLIGTQFPQRKRAQVVNQIPSVISSALSVSNHTRLGVLFPTWLGGRVGGLHGRTSQRACEMCCASVGATNMPLGRGWADDDAATRGYSGKRNWRGGVRATKGPAISGIGMRRLQALNEMLARRVEGRRRIAHQAALSGLLSNTGISSRGKSMPLSAASREIFSATRSGKCPHESQLYGAVLTTLRAVAAFSLPPYTWSRMVLTVRIPQTIFK